MSIYSSDPFVWEKEQAGRAGPETAWLLEPGLSQAVCGSICCRLSVSTVEFVNTPWAQPPAALGVSACQSEEVCVLGVGITTPHVLSARQGSHSESLCWPVGEHTPSGSQENIWRVGFSSGGGYLPTPMGVGWGIERQ